jgi:hypothetical protein
MSMTKSLDRSEPSTLLFIKSAQQATQVPVPEHFCV